MFNFLSKNKKGFTIVELVVVLLLLSFGVLALANMFKVTYRAFQKAEERSIKQEAVKTVAELLRSGSNNVSAAQTADVFRKISVVPTASAKDESYSYLFVDPHMVCSVCEAEWDIANDKCPTSGCTEGMAMMDGSFLYILNKGSTRENAIQLSDVPIYVEMRVYEDVSYAGGPIENQCGIVINLSALENDYFTELKKAGDQNRNGSIGFEDFPVTSDYKYYTLDVAYHFPNMVTRDTGGTVNYSSKGILSSANTYNSSGEVDGYEFAAECYADINDEGEITQYIPCGMHPDNTFCGCDPNAVAPIDDDDEVAAIAPHIYCADCDCKCPLKNATVLRVFVDSILSGDDTNTSVAVPKLCFIATASYGQDSGEVGLLCKFRDECLLTNPLGTAFVKAYYKLSPPIADFIRESEPLKAAVRFGLKPLVAIATNALDEDAAAQNAPWFMMFMLCGAGATATLIKVDKRRKKAR